MLAPHERRYAENLKDRYSRYMLLSALIVPPALMVYSTAYAFSNAPSFLVKPPSQTVAVLNAVSIALIVMSITLVVMVVVGRSAASSYSFRSAKSMLLISLVQCLILLPVSLAGTALMATSAEAIGAQAPRWFIIAMGVGSSAIYAASLTFLFMARNVMAQLFDYYIPKRRVEKPGGPVKGVP